MFYSATRRADPVNSPNVRGKTTMRSPKDVVANPWNPNRMTPEMLDSLRSDFRNEGYIAAQAVLVWGKDDAGKTRNMIIDGEHRWTAASQEGFAKIPMVFLDGLSESEAKALTIKMNQKRGQFVEELLAPVVQGLQETIEAGAMADLGFDQKQLDKLLSFSSDVGGGKAKSKGTERVGSPVDPASVRVVQLFYDNDGAAKFDASMEKLVKEYGNENASEVVIEAMRREAERAAK